jgi:hypothetical protein
MAGSASHQGERRSIKRQQELGACKSRGVKANALCHPLGSKPALFCFLCHCALLLLQWVESRIDSGVSRKNPKELRNRWTAAPSTFYSRIDSKVSRKNLKSCEIA